jgi:signal transduction histidine kinase
VSAEVFIYLVVGILFGVGLRHFIPTINDFFKNRHATIVKKTDENTVELSQTEPNAESLRKTHENEKFKALTTLASGLAHELKNPLSAILGSASLIREYVGDSNSDKVNVQVETVHRHIQRIVTILDRLLEFAQSQKSLEFHEVDILTSLNNSLLTLESELKNKSIQVLIESDANTRVMGNPSQIEIVFNNLMTNSIHAFAEVENFQYGTIRIDIQNKGDLLVVNFSDNARGMSEECRLRLFEPFYTVKAVGKGTGLGMSIVLGIMNAHNAQIQVNSEPGTGTQFQLVFQKQRSQMTEFKAA